jgi:hypothetical protein
MFLPAVPGLGPIPAETLVPLFWFPVKTPIATTLPLKPLSIFSPALKITLSNVFTMAKNPSKPNVSHFLSHLSFFKKSFRLIPLLQS